MVKKRSHLTNSVSSKNRMVRVAAVAVLATAVILLATYFVVEGPGLSEAEYFQRLESAKAALSIGEYDLAEEFAASIGVESQYWRAASLVAGEAAFRDGRYEQSIEKYLQAADEQSADGLLAIFSAAEVFLRQGDLENALVNYKRVHQVDPSFEDVRSRIAFLLGITGQKWEAMPYLIDMIRDKSWSLQSLGILADLERSIEQPDLVERCIAFAPDAPLSLLALASQKIADGDPQSAVGLLQQVITARPKLLAAHGMLGEVQVAEDVSKFQQWNESLPGDANEHPEIWFVRGVVARGAGQLEIAAGCFAKTLVLCPEHRRATYQLGQTLVALKHPNAGMFVERAIQQMELSRHVDDVLKSNGRNLPAVKKTAELSEQLGRYLEAWAWATSVSEMFGSEPWSVDLTARVARNLSSDAPRTLPQFRLTDQADLSSLTSLASSDSFENIYLLTSRSTRSNSAESGPTAKIKFSDNLLVPEFIYNNGADPATRGVRMFEQTGGGVGVIDFDADNWPDLYFTQGNEWKTDSTIPEQNPAFHDALYRNLSGAGLSEQSRQAGIENISFSQGVTVGDYDADGFQDIYVAAVGANRLYHNNGDGTFSDQSDKFDTLSSRWTTSCAMVDLNGDSLPEIFDVNYLEGDGVYTKICGGRGCSPKVFAGSADQIFVNDGNGGFRRLDSVTPQAEAKGLGILIGRFGADKQPSIFIANDQVSNFLLVPSFDADGDLIMQDRALVAGVAFNVDGLAMACMGIASEDLDGNGLLDFLVTNFADEPNSLYLQDAEGLFIDATRASGLLDVSYPYVGWGTQFLDADRDGESDLVVGNGHVDDYRDEGKLYQMPAQFFRNSGGGRFQQLSPQSLGGFFQENYLSRGLVRLDWNRDGLFDFAVSNINQASGLVVNQTVGAGDFLNVVLHGTESAREPIGSIVSVETDQKSWTKQLTAGDGFQASNQRILQFGLGNSHQIKAITVKWPSGLQSRIEGVPTGSTLHIVESASRGFTEQGIDVQVTDNEPSTL